MNIEKIESIAKRRGIIFPSSEIYGGLSGFFDYGPVGKLLKQKIKKSWKEFFLKPDNIPEIETSLVTHEKVWKASGHVNSFIDPLTQCDKCKRFYRADNLIEETTGKFVEGMESEELTKIIKENKIRCPKCKGSLGDVKVFNLMLSSNVGPVAGSTAYLRPETAQGIFINFKNLVASMRATLPFSVAQIGTSYRNEISPRQWIMRLREFRQMEIETFFNPKKSDQVANFDKFAKTKIKLLTREQQKKKGDPIDITAQDTVKKNIIPNNFLAYYLAKEFLWYQQLGIPAEALRFRHMLPEETPHYSSGNFDLEIKFDFGWKEVVGNSYRNDHDLQNHMKLSGENFSIVDGEEKIVPHIVEPSFGIDRTIYAVLLYSYREGKDRGWEWLEFPPKIAPYVAGIFPLVNKDKIPEKSIEVFNLLRNEFDVFYDDSGSIGKRYARSDEIGTLTTITCDYQTLTENTVTIRDRNTTKQIRVSIQDLKSTLSKFLEGATFEEMGKFVK